MDHKLRQAPTCQLVCCDTIITPVLVFIVIPMTPPSADARSSVCGSGPRFFLEWRDGCGSVRCRILVRPGWYHHVLGSIRGIPAVPGLL